MKKICYLSSVKLTLMNWKFYFFIGAVCLSSISCQKEKPLEIKPYEQTQLTIIEPIEFEIPSLIGLNLPFQIPFLNVPLNISTSEENTNPDIDLIRNIHLQDFVIRIISPQGQNFDFLKDIEIYISTDVLPEIKMAHHYNVDSSIGSEMHLVPENIVLDDYLKSESFDLRLELVADQLIFSNLIIRGEWILDAELINNP